jgi:hypothetical protein
MWIGIFSRTLWAGVRKCLPWLLGATHRGKGTVFEKLQKDSWWPQGVVMKKILKQMKPGKSYTYRDFD